jgi:hypothetical protein
MIEWRWGLAPLSVRDATANNLTDLLDFRQSRRAHYTDDEKRTLEDALTRYSTLAARLYDSLVLDPVRYATFKALTAERERRTLKGKVDSHNSTTINDHSLWVRARIDCKAGRARSVPPAKYFWNSPRTGR